MHQPKADQALWRLDALVGEWTLEAIGPDGEPWPGQGRATFEWDESGAHLTERATNDHPDAPDVSNVIGCDAGNGTYVQLYSDNRGICRVYEMAIDESQWKLWRQGDPFDQRFTGTFSEDGNTINGRWERADAGSEYTTDFDLIYRKVTG
jgi:hypothetical protein